MNQLALVATATAGHDEPELASYDHILVAVSGKDSLATLLHLLELGADPGRIELHHHLVDGREGSDLMDWPCTEDYWRKMARELRLPIFYSWKVNGIEGEMLRNGTPTAPIAAETPENGVLRSGGEGPAGTRRRFPQVSASHSVRWCTSYAKADVCARSISMQERFDGKRVLLVTGERAEESSARAMYSAFQPHKTSNRKRTVHQWRAVLGWREQDVWAIIKRWSLIAHPAYYVGVSRASCLFCVFAGPDMLATAREIAPVKFARIAAYEQEFGVTIRRDGNVHETADRGKSFAVDPDAIAAAMSKEYRGPVRVPASQWKLPAGAYRGHAGPT